jgi:hypothetical protein
LLEHSEKHRTAKQIQPQLKQAEIEGLIEAVINKLILELTKDPLGHEWLVLAVENAKSKILKDSIVRTGDKDFDSMLNHGLKHFADHAQGAKSTVEFFTPKNNFDQNPDPFVT